MKKSENTIIGYSAPLLEVATVGVERGIAVTGGYGEPGSIVYDPEDNTTL